jgi:hypothetical protein
LGRGPDPRGEERSKGLKKSHEIRIRIEQHAPVVPGTLGQPLSNP